MTMILDGSLGVTFPVVAATGSAVQASSGRVLQVVQTVKTDTFTTTNSALTDVTGLSVSITPSSSSNKILIFCDVGASCASGSGMLIRLLRGSTAIYIGDAASSRPLAYAQLEGGSSLYSVYRCTAIYLDSPSTTSSTTYKIQVNNSASATSAVNRTQQDRDTSLYDARAASSITVMEIAA
jgi:hypothetical protein